MPNNSPDTQKNKAGSEGVDTPGFDKNPFNAIADGKPFNSLKDKYASPQSILDEGQKLLSTVRSKKAPNADNPTTAAADPKLKLPEAVLKMDPLGKSQILTGMFKAMKLARSIMSSNDSTSHNQKTTDSLTGALRKLCEKYGFEKVIMSLETSLSLGKFSQITPAYQSIVQNALSTLIQEAVLNGDQNIKGRVLPTITYGTTVPSPLYTYANVPDLYVQQYHDQEDDPYPGYIQWENPDNAGVYVYSKRTPEQLPFSTSDEEIVANCEIAIANSLDSLILSNTLNVSILNSVLDQQITNIQNQGMEKALGKNSSLNLGLLNSLMGAAGIASNLTKNGFLPQSVLSQGSVGQSLDKFNKNIAFIKKMKQTTNSAFALPSQLTGLTNLTSLAGLTSLGNIANLANAASFVSSLTGMNPSTAISTVMQVSGLNSSVSIGSTYNVMKSIGIA